MKKIEALIKEMEEAKAQDETLSNQDILSLLKIQAIDNLAFQIKLMRMK